MKPPRVRVGTLMAVVGVAAVDFAACRALFGRNGSYGSNLLWLTAVGPIGVTLQLAFFRAIRCRGRARAFWLGFLALGASAVVSVIASLSDPASECISISESGAVVRASYPGGPMTRVWTAYFGFAYEALMRSHVTTVTLSSEPLSSLIDVVLFTLPQLLIASAGGLLARRAVRRPGSAAATDGNGFPKVEGR